MATVATEARGRLSYRPELDGIRGLAVLLVLASHARVPGFEGGGMVGVTLFFVLSGFLITGLLRQELARTGRVDLRAFYVRRIRRLVPALVALVAFCLPWITFLGLPWAFDAVASLTYTTSFLQSAGHPLALLNGTWSLSVEELFYLCWPALFILGRGKRGLLVALLGGIAASMAVRSVLEGSTLTFNRPDVRMDAILWGSLAAFWPGQWGRLLGWVGLVVVLLTTLTNPEAMQSGLTYAALGSLGVVVAARPGWLSWRPLVRTGQISYGLYLWQMPFVYILTPDAESATLAGQVLLVVLVFGAALISERWVERPFRSPRPVELEVAHDGGARREADAAGLDLRERRPNERHDHGFGEADRVSV